jgi:hypothetical protein
MEELPMKTISVKKLFLIALMMGGSFFSAHGFTRFANRFLATAPNQRFISRVSQAITNQELRCTFKVIMISFPLIVANDVKKLITKPKIIITNTKNCVSTIASILTFIPRTLAKGVMKDIRTIMSMINKKS